MDHSLRAALVLLLLLDLFGSLPIMISMLRKVEAN
jgi:small neutral amino acid transporter SnatA (MarC family)